MREPERDEPTSMSTSTSTGTLAATLTALLILLAVVILFLILKFNLFHGGKPNNLPTTAPRPQAVVSIV